MDIKVSIASALDRYRVVLDDSYKEQVEKYYKEITAKYGEGRSINKVINDFDYAKIYIRLIKPNQVGGGDYSLDKEKMQKNGDAYASVTLLQWEEKIKNKLENLEDAELKHLNGYSFEMVGKREGKEIRITQSMIVNVSPKGIVFNQFPAKIYVDGKFTSEANYKSLFSK